MGLWACAGPQGCDVSQWMSRASQGHPAGPWFPRAAGWAPVLSSDLLCEVAGSHSSREAAPASGIPAGSKSLVFGNHYHLPHTRNPVFHPESIEDLAISGGVQ